jgi:hypothetical protein
MKFKSVQKKVDRTPEGVARVKALRAKFQKERPTVEQLLASGEYTEPVHLRVYLETKLLLHRLNMERGES